MSEKHAADVRQASILDCGTGSYSFHAVKKIPYGNGWMCVACCGADRRTTGGTMTGSTKDAHTIAPANRCRSVACRKAFDEADRLATNPEQSA